MYPSSYQNQQPNNDRNLYDNADLYEYDGPERKSFFGRFRSIFSATNQNGTDSDNHYKRDCLDSMCTNINQTLIVPKAFYFFYFAAFGSLFPLMGIYFKQMAMTSLQVGILLGFRPFVEFISAPFWASIGERWRKGRLILLGSMLCWIGFTLAMGFIKPPVHSCMRLNESSVVLEKSNYKNNPKKRDFNSDQNLFLHDQPFLIINRRAIKKITIIRNLTKITAPVTRFYTTINITDATTTTKLKATSKSSFSNETLNTALNSVTEESLNKTITRIANTNNIVESFASDIAKSIKTEKKTSTTKSSGGKSDNANYYGTPPNNIDQDLIKPKLQTSIVYNKKDVRRVFLVFLFLLLAGEFFCAPAITIADSCTLQYLGPSRADLYGRQRMFGSIGWALAMFVIGLLLDQSKAFTEHPCGQAGPDERNYTVCFAIYSVLMACAFVIATQFKFSYSDGEQIPLKSFKQKAKAKINKIRDPRYKQFDRQQFVNEEDDNNSNEGDDYNVIDAEMPPAKPPPINEGYINTGFVEINSNDLKQQKYRMLLETCKSVKHISFLFIVWFMGIGVGLVFTFLFWHLQGITILKF